MKPSLKPQAQLSLETILQQNKDEAERLQVEAKAKLEENAKIEEAMQKILSEPPPSASVPPTSRLLQAFAEGHGGTYQNGHTMGLMATENARTVPAGPVTAPPVSTAMAAKNEVLYAALAIVRSWQRRHKKKFNNQESELVKAVSALTWDK